MKIGYECWRRDCKIQELLLDAIRITLKEKLDLSTAMVQKYIYSADGVPSTFSEPHGSASNLRITLKDSSDAKRQVA